MAAQTTPWISFHAPWTSRLRDLKLLAQIERFVAACAIDPAPDSATLEVYDDMRGRESADYRPDARVEATTARFGPGTQSFWGHGMQRWSWQHRKQPFDSKALIDYFAAHEGDPPIERAPGRRGVHLFLSYWFEAKRPGADAPLFPGASLRSAVLLHLGLHSVNLSLRYDSAELTPALRAAHGEILATFDPPLKRGVLQRITPATKPGGRERREPLT